MHTFLFYAAALAALGMVRFHARPDDQSGTPGLGPETGPKTPEAGDAQRRRHALQAQRTLADKYDAEAKAESERTGRPVTPRAVPSIEDILAGHSDEPGATSGPNPGTQELRPGESLTGPATGALARQSLHPEHQSKLTTPTVNAPGTGADSGLKKTPDNPDARAGEFGHADGVDPADKGFPGAVAPERTDTLAEQTKRQAAEDELNAAVSRGEAPTREQLLAAGCPESELEAALRAGADEAASRKATLEAEAAGRAGGERDGAE